MYCLKCGSSLKEGQVYCPVCGHAVELVPVYTEFDEIINEHVEKGIQESNKKAVKPKPKQKPAQPAKDDKPKENRSAQKKKYLFPVFFFCFVCILVLFFFSLRVKLENEKSFDYQMDRAWERKEAEEYAYALEHVERALELEPGEQEAVLLLADIYRLIKVYDEAEEVLLNASAETGSKVYLERLIRLYEETGDYLKIHEILQNADEETVEKYAKYKTYKPIFSLDAGVHNKEKNLELFSEKGDIYYTLDGSEPDQNSQFYESAIRLAEGTTVVSVVVYNSYDMPGEIITREFQIEPDAPSAPSVTPSSGTFQSSTSIEILVPEGYTAYYLYDDSEDIAPDETSSLYTGPIQMRDGKHIFKAVLVDSSGRRSNMSTRVYRLER